MNCARLRSRCIYQGAMMPIDEILRTSRRGRFTMPSADLSAYGLSDDVVKIHHCVPTSIMTHRAKILCTPFYQAPYPTSSQHSRGVLLPHEMGLMRHPVLQSTLKASGEQKCSHLPLCAAEYAQRHNRENVHSSRASTRHARGTAVG